ncbi:phage tail tape measure protein [Pseudomonas sp.]|uniref:phage tail tape measure protein n=1 Tax=Pseudomonas sp. TaxID=306 RepID=UPI003F95D672
MSTTFASLGISVESSQAVKAADDLDKLVDAAEGAEKAVDDLGRAGEGLANTGKKITQAETEAAQGIDKTTSAWERQAGATRKATDSATSEIAIISQLDKAMTGNIGSMESLIQAEGLLERARKGGLVTIEEQARYQDQLGKAYDKIEKAEAKEAAQKQRQIEAENRRIEALKRTVNSIDPLVAQLAKLEAKEKALNDLHKAGGIDAAAYAERLATIGKDRAGIEKTATGIEALNLGSRRAKESLSQLGNALTSGDFASGARAVARLGAGAGVSAASLLAIVGPIAAVAGAVAGLAYAYSKGSQEGQEFNKSLILTGNFAGTSSGLLADMARQISATVGTTGAAAEVLATLAGNGKLASGSFVEISEAALAMQKATGKSVDETVAEFVKISDDPVAAAKSLNDQYHFLTASVYSQIVALKEQGDTVGAAKLLTDTYADTVKVRAGQISQNLGIIEKGWNLVRDAAKGALDATLNVGRQETLTQQAQALREKLSSPGAYSTLPIFGEDNPDLLKVGRSREEDQKQLDLLESYIEIEKRQSKYLGDQDVAQKAAMEAQEKVDTLTKSSMTNEQKRADAIKEYKRQLDDIRKASPNDERLNQSVIDRNIASINDRFKDPKAASTAVDLTAFNDAKNNLAGIVDEYKNAQKQLDAAQKAGLVSQADYLLKRQAMIGNERDEVTAGYEAEIAALEATKGKTSTSAAQRIQLDQKIADARTAMVKAQKDSDSELAVLATNEKGRLEKQEFAVKKYVEALGEQQKALALAGQRAVVGVGQGDREKALSAELNAQQDRFAQQSLELANQQSDPSRKMDPEEFRRKSQALADANKAATDQIRQNYADVEAAQGDWTKGASSAWANYLDSARDVAGQTKSLFTNAFSSMEDAVANFAITGKLSFADFTKSILADMARIAARQASSSLLSSLVGVATSYFGGSASGGNGLAAGSAGAASSNLGASAGGYSGSYFPQAKGGAWSGGVQMFANGGAFTNSIVSQPTAFGMAGGKPGVMGEAGPEAIMPLTRTAGGKLGVMAVGGAGSGGSTLSFPITVQVDASGNGGAGTGEDAAAFGKAVQDAAKVEAESAIRKGLQPGGNIWRVINAR